MAEKRPATLDAMAGIGGVGAKKLERYGAMFLEVITGATETLHPARRRLAGREAGTVYDRLVQVQADLARGEDGGEKPLSCSSAQLAKVAQLRAGDERGLTRLLGDRRAERFGAAFLDVLRAEA
jgi:ATP-dependent DNA helicase RecQ